MCEADGSCGCGCPTKGKGSGASRHARSKGSQSRRDTTRDQAYRFATAAALVRYERMTAPEARHAVSSRPDLIDSLMRQRMSPTLAADYIASLTTKKPTRSSYPPASRDPGSRRRKPPKRAAKKRYSKGSGGSTFQRCPRGMRIQTIIFRLDEFNEKKATAWVRSHGFRVQKLDLTSQSIRIRQQPVELFVKGSFRTITLPSRTGVIRAVVGCPRFAIIAGGRRQRKVTETIPARRRKTRKTRRLRRAA